GLHRGGQDGVGVAAGHADAHTAHVDAEAPPGSGPSTRIVLVRIVGPVGRAVLCGVHSTDPRYRGDLGADRVERGVDAGRVLAGALRQVRLAATAAVDRRGQLLDQVIGADPQILGG